MIRGDRQTPEGLSSAPRVSFFTLGCRLNQHDTAAMRARLADAGWAEVDAAEGADVVVVNTCTVTARADQEARQLVRSLARRAPMARIVVTGCYAQRAPGEVAAIDGVSLVLGLAERDRIEEYLGVGSGEWEGGGRIQSFARSAKQLYAPGAHPVPAPAQKVLSAVDGREKKTGRPAGAGRP